MRHPILIAALLPLLLAGCGQAAEPADSPDLNGHTYVSQSVSGYDLVDGTRVTLAFGDGTLGADAGCNRLSGAFTIKDDALAVGSLAGTEMACRPQSKMDQDQWLAAFLTSDPDVVLTGGVLTLSQDGVTVVLSEKQVVDTPLEGTDWSLEGIISGSGADATVSNLPPQVRGAGLRISSGRITIDTGVNSGGGPVTVSATTLAFGVIEMTEIGTTDPDAQQVEQVMVSTLRGTAAYEIDGKTLTITSEDGESGLVFRAS